jgi:hypothetical protein
MAVNVDDDQPAPHAAGRRWSSAEEKICRNLTVRVGCSSRAHWQET